MKPLFPALALSVLLATPAFAQDYTTAAEVKPILMMTQPQWIAVRPYEGRDLLYFTNLLAWRCGVESVAYGLNGDAAETPLAIEPCYEGEASPNALKMDQGIMPYIEAPIDSIATITVRVTFDDGSVEEFSYDRKSVQIQ